MKGIYKEDTLITIWYVGRWSSVNEDITDQLRTAKAILQLWEPFDILCTEAAAKLQQHEEQCTQFLDAHMPEDNLVETLKQRIQDIKVHEYVSAALYKPARIYRSKQTQQSQQIKRTPSFFPCPLPQPPKSSQ